MDLTNKKVLLTGAGRGIGKAALLRLVGEGCQVMGVARSESELNEAVREANGSTGKAFAFPADLADMKSVDRI
ncbi:MAG: SDR family NAD(P)-dependent oxidoreductase [Kiritimatiellae bacterium]|nr:SDR family NAD(P)-dependent oxidoreductase [Kiritimatiellia bacterium]